MLFKAEKFYDTIGDVKTQRELLERSLKIKEKHFGADHSETAANLHRLGRVYHLIGYLEKAREYLER